MKRDFLRGLGIEDKEIIDKILDENSADIGKAKGEFEALKTQVSELTSQLNDKDKQLEDLENIKKEKEALTTKVTELEEANKTTVTDWEGKYTALEKTHAIEGGIRDAKGKNIKAITALLDLEKITKVDGKWTGIAEQLEGLVKDEASAMLFGENKPQNPTGTNPNNPPTNQSAPTGDTFTNAIAKNNFFFSKKETD